jgi:protein transport protein SEC23
MIRPLHRGVCFLLFTICSCRTKEYASQQIQDMLGLQGAGRVAPGQRPSGGRFVLPMSQASFTIQNVIGEMQRDSWPVIGDQRAQRATGAALCVATALLEILCGNTSGRVVLLTSGPCTIGPGQVVDILLKEPLRSHHDIERDQARHYKKARAFYSSLKERLTAGSHSWGVDVFAASYDQVGLFEMNDMIHMSGGVMVLSDAYQSTLFQSSYLRYMALMAGTDANGVLAFHGTFEVLVSKEIRVSGLIGPVTSLNKKGPSVSDTVVGTGGTLAWKLNALSPQTTLAVYFDMAPVATGVQRGFVQFMTYFQRGVQLYLRVTTLSRSILDMAASGALGYNPSAGGSPLSHLKGAFDQEVAAVIMARLAVHKSEQALQDASVSTQDVLRWIDRTLIRLCQHMADYRKDDPTSFSLPSTFAIYPQFVFHLRRSPFLMVFNASPDETAFVRSALQRQDTAQCLTMIQPTLTSFALGKEPMPALLDTISLQPDVILLLDSYFHVVVYQGATIAAWVKEGQVFDDMRDREDESHIGPPLGSLIVRPG